MVIPGYTIMHRIGQGRFSSLYLAKNSIGVIRAIKIIKSSLSEQELFRREFKKHIKPLMSINHPGCIKVYEAGIIDKQCYIIMDYFPDGSIAPRLIFGFPVKHIIKILLELIDAVEYLQKSNIVHRNIQPRNIFITQNNQTILSEYEVVSQILQDCPEIEFKEDQFLKQLVDCQTDVNCLGLVFFKLLNRETTPYLEIPIQSLSGSRAVCWQPTINKLFSNKHDEAIGDVYQLRNEIHRVQNEFEQRIDQEKIQFESSDSTKIEHGCTDLVVYEDTPNKVNLPSIIKAYNDNKFQIEEFITDNKTPIMTGLAACASFVIVFSLSTYFDKKYGASELANQNVRPDILFPQQHPSVKLAPQVQSDKIQLTEADIRQKKRLENFKIEKQRLAQLKQKEEAERLTVLKQKEEAERLAVLKQKEEIERLAELKQKEEVERLTMLKQKEEAERLVVLKQKEAAAHLAALKQKKEELLISLQQKKEDDRKIDLKLRKEQQRLENAKNNNQKRLLAAKKEQKELEQINYEQLEAEHFSRLKNEKELRKKRLEAARIEAEKQELAIQEKQLIKQLEKESKKTKPKFESFATF
ncbi:MAG: protein kinase [Gammaproteobacteria bacterium]|nr:protein kinase [Gammaproteobacteria bacterium]